MSKTIGKKGATALITALLVTAVLALPAAILVVNGVIVMERVPLWMLRVTGPLVGALTITIKPQKHKRKRRR